MKRFLKLIGLLFSLVFGVYLFTEPLYTPTALLTPAYHANFPKYIAYSGDTFEVIQETLTGYEEGITIEIKFSEGGMPFLYGSKLVTLEDILKLVGSQKYIFLNIKTDKIFNAEAAQRIVELIQKYHLQETVIVESFNPFFLISMRLKARDILVMYSFTDRTSSFNKLSWLFKNSFFQKQMRRLIRPDILGVQGKLKEKLLTALIYQGYPIIYENVDSPQLAEKLFKLGVKGIKTNNRLLWTGSDFGPQIVYDAGGSRQRVQKVIHVKNAQDVLQAIVEAKANNKKITIAGRRHSMGGQTLLDGSIQLNMRGIDHVNYDVKTRIVKMGAGATWKKLQSILDQHGRSIKVMQSDNIFTVGGSISVNIHGWQVGEPPIASGILSLKVITADGMIRQLNKQSEPELFKAVIGGYGQFGVILEAELETTSNTALQFQAEFMKPEEFSNKFREKITKNNKVELAYGRLSVDRDHLFEEAGLFWYEKVENLSSEPLHAESLIAFKRGIFRSSEYFELGKRMRWAAEKIYAKKLMAGGFTSRNNAMNTDVHILWPLYGENKDILHEYFIPKAKLTEFLKMFKQLIVDFDMNILNATIREIRQDKISFLPYAQQDVFAIVCLFSQETTAKDEEKMKQFTETVIDEVIRLKGTFYLPYRLHYTKDQLLKAYPNIIDWIKFKDKWDPSNLFDSQFFQYINSR
jgi:FAD/FMN-containing dehydrogenase